MLSTLIVALLQMLQPAVASRDWQPERTWVFAVGILEWPKAAGLGAFPQKGRRDAELVEHFKSRGVPADQIRFLKDEEATLANIRTGLRTFLPKVRRGDLLIVYYAGHGSYGPEKSLQLANYDAATAWWSVPGLISAIEGNVDGAKVWLMADCCFSGGLAQEVGKKPRRNSYGCLTSAHVHSTSTGNWTFTDCILQGLRGDPRLDRDSDGAVQFGELAHHVELTMAFAEGQKATTRFDTQFSKEFRVSGVDKTLPKDPLGERVEIFWKEQWYRGWILEKGNDKKKVKVRYAGFGPEWDEWVGPERWRPYKTLTLAAKTPVKVQWNKEWYKATILRSWEGLHLVHYVGFGPEWDEWVGPERIRKGP